MKNGSDLSDTQDTAPPSSTSVLFAHCAPVLVVGDSAGFVTCYRVKGMTMQAPLSVEDQVRTSVIVRDKRNYTPQIERLKSVMYPEAKA